MTIFFLRWSCNENSEKDRNYDRFKCGVLFLTMIGGAYYFWRMTLPQYEGELPLANLTNPVTVIRDSWGIPHIQAGSEEDAIRAMGYVVAQDRFWQMEFIRRVMSGRLSEITGEVSLPLDKLMRTVGNWPRVQEEVKQLKEDDRKLIQAYCDGVNQFLTNEELPIEFTILGFEPEPWRIEDTLLTMKMLAFWLTWWQVDVFLGEILPHLDEARFNQLIPYFPEDAPTIIRSDSTKAMSINNESSKLYRDLATVDPDIKKGLDLFAEYLGKGGQTVGSFPDPKQQPVNRY